MSMDRLELNDVRRRYVDGHRRLPVDIELALRADPRKIAQNLLAAIERRRRANRAEGQRLRNMLRYERALWNNSVSLVGGVDECGMSPLAGPVVASAVILPIEFKWPGVDDSKKLDAATREKLADVIKKRAVTWSIGIVDVEEIDRINIYRAGLLAMRRAIEGLSPTPEALLIDARKLPEIPIRQQAIIHGDALSLSIAAASIVAKTTRDAMMCKLDKQYPGYGFAKHKGYGVRQHYEALDRLGVLPIHRRSFGPVKRALGIVPEQLEMPQY